MRFISGVDARSIEFIEKLTQKIELLYGVTNFRLAKIFLGLTTVLSFYDNAESFAKYNIFDPSNIAFFIVGSGMSIWVYVAWLTMIIGTENRFGKSPSTKNPMKIFPILIIARFIFTVLAILITVLNSFKGIKLEIFSFPILCLILFLVACDPLPPGTQSKLSKWWNSLSLRTPVAQSS